MKAPVDLIGTHTATGASSIVHTLGEAVAGRSDKIADKTRIIQVTGIAGGSVMTIEGSLDQTHWGAIGSTITADTLMILDDGIRHIRSNCTTYGSGTVSVYAQKFVEES